MRHVYRLAKVGEIIKIVKAYHLHEYEINPEYTNGDILRVDKVENHRVYVNGIDEYLQVSEYVVLENFDYSVFPKNEPRKKAKVGDKIKVVRDAGHHGPKLVIGDIHKVISMSCDNKGIMTDKSNVLLDNDQEYIIIEEAPIAPTPEDTEIKVGDAVKVVNGGKSWDTYAEWFEKHEPKLVARYAYNRVVENGYVGKVIAKHDSDSSYGMAYAISQGDYYEVYLVHDGAIEKVRN
jgi:hypothetical protein